SYQLLPAITIHPKQTSRPSIRTRHVGPSEANPALPASARGPDSSSARSCGKLRHRAVISFGKDANVAAWMPSPCSTGRREFCELSGARSSWLQEAHIVVGSEPCVSSQCTRRGRLSRGWSGARGRRKLREGSPVGGHRSVSFASRRSRRAIREDRLSRGVEDS